MIEGRRVLFQKEAEEFMWLSGRQSYGYQEKG
jgi:hypothetical protein